MVNNLEAFGSFGSSGTNLTVQGTNLTVQGTNLTVLGSFGSVKTT